MKKQKKLIVIVGPTAVGKTEISLIAADTIDGEIISGDSMQVYRGMDIGTAKICPEEMVGPSGRKIPHHLIDILDPDETFSVADFQRLAREAITSINDRNRIPMIVGGTGLYINGVVDPYHFAGMEINPDLRRMLWEEAESLGDQYMHRQLEEVDPETARRIHPHDTKRIIRALEIYRQTGRTMTETLDHAPLNSPGYRLVMVGLYMERELLYERINLRVDHMVEKGLIEEVKSLLQQGYHDNLNSMQGLGYRQIASYLRGNLTKEEAIRLIKRDTRRFAKRQWTWFKRDSRIHWFNVGNIRENYLCGEEITRYICRTLETFVE